MQRSSIVNNRSRSKPKAKLNLFHSTTLTGCAFPCLAISLSITPAESVSLAPSLTRCLVFAVSTVASPHRARGGNLADVPVMDEVQPTVPSPDLALRLDSSKRRKKNVFFFFFFLSFSPLNA
jgi:hypothetical protein